MSRDDNWRVLVIPPFALLWLLVFFLLPLTDDNPLRDRQVRTRIFDKLLAEMKGMEIPGNSAINHTESWHKEPSIYISTRYRSEAKKEDFYEEMAANLERRGWIEYPGEHDRSTDRTFHFCRGMEDAKLYLRSRGIFDSDVADYWTLSFYAGLSRSELSLFGKARTMPAECSAQ